MRFVDIARSTSRLEMERMSMAVSRRILLKASGGALLPLAAPFAGRANEARILRFAPQANLSVLDPVWNTAAVTIAHGYCVFDTLYGVDAQLRPRPQMAEGATVSDDGRTWMVRLRDGLRFHNGEPVRAQDCAASLERWSKRDTFGQTLGAVTESFAAADDRTLRVTLKRPFPRFLDAIGKPHSSPALIMPEHLARTDPMRQVTEMIGSGPFRFRATEYVSGSRMVYERFEGYVPREEPAEWTAGGKRAHVDRVEWRVMPDPATAAAALQRGEIDWWEQAMPDLIPVLLRRGGIRVQPKDQYGFVGLGRFNVLHPPFNNVALRRAVLSAIRQEDYMQSTIGPEAPDAWRRCFAMFTCGMPGVNEEAASILGGGRDIARAREAVRASGYAGEKVVIINPTDQPTIAPHGHVTNQLFRALGLNVELQEMDWGSVVQRRISREPVERNGWSFYHTNLPGVAIANPALNTAIRGDGAWPGFFTDAETERLATEWLFAEQPAQQQALFDAIHRRALDQVPTLPLGQFFVRTAFRDQVRGVLDGSVAYFWNIRKE